MGRTKRKTETPRTPGTPLDDPVRERYAGKRAMGFSKCASFRDANPTSDTMSRDSIYTMAARMDAEPDVRARTAEITSDLLRSSDAYLTKEKMAELLSDAIRRALTEDELFSSGAGLVDKYCKMFGFYEPEKTEVKLGCVDESVTNAKIARLLKLNDSKHKKT